jgi:hypothetical protein
VRLAQATAGKCAATGATPSGGRPCRLNRRCVTMAEDCHAWSADVARLERGLFALLPRKTDLVTVVQETAARFRSERDSALVESPHS